MTNNKLTDKRIAQLANRSFYPTESDSYVPFGDEVVSMAAELQKRRKADSAEPVAWRYRTTDINGNPNPRWSFSEEPSLLGLYQPLYADPQQPLSFPDAMEPTVEAIKRVLPTSNPDEYAVCIGADMWNACRATMLQANQRDLSQPVDPQVAEYEQIMLQAGWVMVPVEPTDEMIVAAMDSDDVTYNESDDTVFYVHHREIYKAMLAAAPKPQNAPQNIPAGKSTLTPDGWISCSDRMPEEGAYISAVSRHGEYVAGKVIDNWLDLHDGTSFGLDEVYLWMMLPPLPASPQQ
ncbi:TPA: DUF551 domain-containing protein [Salmonella enterica]